MLAPRVKNFAQKKDYLWNMSCSICGDVSKGRQKARGYIYKVPGQGTLNYKCHHCGASMSLGSFLKQTQPDLFKQYVFDNYQETSKARVPHANIKELVKVDAVDTSVTLIDASLDRLKCCGKLDDTHPVARYLAKRKIPRDKWDLIFYTTKFKTYTNSLIPGKFKDVETDHPRLIFPYFNSHGKMFAYSARSFTDEHQPKYYTIKLDDSERIYGLDRIDYTKRIYAVEGPIDSLFLPNCIAVSGSSFDMPSLQALKSNITIISDNEPRSREIVKIVKKNIMLGYSVCMLPHSIQYKDVNEMILGGMTQEEILELINDNTYRGTEAIMHFNFDWRRA